VIEETGFVDVEFGSMVDTFAGANAEEKARKYGSYGYAIRARKPV
jgi:hypothetical protein